MASICIVEDEGSIAEMIAMNLKMEGFEVEVYADGLKAKQAASGFSKHALIILDVMLPNVSGLEICDEIRKYSNVPVLFLSAKGTTADKIEGLKKGGNDYLSKPFELEELLLRVKVLTAGTSSNTTVADTIQIGDKTIDFKSFEVHEIKSGQLISSLSKREIELLQLFVEKEGEVVSRDEILDRLWGKDQFPTSRTIDNYILTFRKLFEKDARNPEYFHSIRSVGYRFTNQG